MELDLYSILSIIGWIIGGVFTLAFSVKKTYNPNGLRWKRAFKGQLELKNLLQEFVYQSQDISRAALIFAENGGGIPHPGSDIKTSILTEAFDSKLTPYLDKWQKVPVDNSYAKMLAEVATKGYVIVKDTNSLSDGPVKHSTLSDGINAFELHYIAANKKQWFYLVLSTHNELPADARYKDSVRVLRHRLADVVKR